MRRNFIIPAVLLCMSLAAASAWAESEKSILAFMGNSSEPVDVSSRHGEFRSLPKGYETILTGNVKVSQADMTLTCDKLITVYEKKEGSKSRSGNPKLPSGDIANAENIKTITALGHVKIVQRDTVATAGKAVYDNAKRTITLSEDPRLRRGANTLQAGTIVIFLDLNKIDFKGGGGPIRGQLVPGRQRK